jgi:hypothetical protein
MNPSPPLWDPEAKTFSFFLQKRDRKSVPCIVTIDALEHAVQSRDLSELPLTRIFVVEGDALDKAWRNLPGR